MSNKFSVTLYKNNIMTKDGKREVYRVRSWDAFTDESGKVSFKPKLTAAMSVPIGALDQFAWQPIVSAQGEITGHKVKALVYGSINTDKSGSMWLNPFMAHKEDDRKWTVVDRNTPNAQIMVFELAPWQEQESVQNVDAKTPVQSDADMPF
jgi:hypothetical protein